MLLCKTRTAPSRLNKDEAEFNYVSLKRSILFEHRISKFNYNKPNFKFDVVVCGLIYFWQRVVDENKHFS